MCRWVRLESEADTDAGDEAEIVADKGGACRRGPVVVPDAGDADAEAGTQVHGEFEREFEAVAQTELAKALAEFLFNDENMINRMQNGEIKIT